MQQQSFFTAPPLPSTTRRGFLQSAAAGSLILEAGTTLTGCYFGGVELLHRVTSGDPLQDRVILSTRMTPGQEMMANFAHRARTSGSKSALGAL